MDVAYKKLNGLNLIKLIPLLFMMMTFSAILPLYFEGVRQVSGLVFISILLFLSVKPAKDQLCQLSRFEKTWLFIALFYAGFFILNYLLRTPHTPDGEWRIAAPIFVLLISAWYFLSIRYHQKIEIIKYVAVSSVFAALLLFMVEISLSESLSGYRFGAVLDGARGIAATGFILPITTLLLLVIWFKERSWLYAGLLLIGFILSALNGSRTAFSLILMTILFGSIYVFFFAKSLGRRVKIGILTSLIVLIVASAWLSQSKLMSTVSDLSGIQKGNYSTSMGLRYAMFDTGIQALQNHWLLGVGPSDYKRHVTTVSDTMNYTESVKAFSSGAMQLHNQYIMSLLLTGLLGFASLLLFLIYPIRVFLSSFKKNREPTALMSIGLLIGVVFIMFFGAVLTYTYTTIFYMLSMSALVSWFSYREGV